MSLGERGAFTSDQPAGIDIVPNDTSQNLGGAFSSGTARWTFLNIPTLLRSMGILCVYVANASASGSGQSALTIPFPSGSQPTGLLITNDGVSNNLLDIAPQVGTGGVITGVKISALGAVTNTFEQFTLFFMI
jgi:hypothetical protein